MMFYHKFWFLVFLLVGGFFIVFPQLSWVHASEASFLFSPAEVSTNLGDNFTLNVNIDTDGEQVGGAGAKITFDPFFLKVVGIETGKIFSDYPTAAYDNTQGNIIISGIVPSINDLYSGSDVFAKVTFSSRLVGKGVVKFNFVPGSTTDSNIAVTYGSGDILAKVNQANITVKPANDKTDVLVPATATPVAATSSGFFGNAFISILKGIGLGSLVEGLGVHGSESVGVINQRQPADSGSFVSEKNPLESQLLVILVIVIVLIVVIWAVYFYIRSTNKKRKQLPKS